ncbi:MAG: hypothetical protein HOV71_04870 [Hamadaea sp.]|nr:hypothetical protein [Hamadaea sp.]NUR47449.1 hypothetical protein [Hamadaea sp.]
MLLSLGLSACDGDDQPTGRPSAGPAGADPIASAGFPGLYHDASNVSVLPGPAEQLRLVGTMTCAEMDAMLSAGQWRVVDRLTLPGGSAGAAIAGIVPGLLLERAGTLAFVTLKGDHDLCTGTVVKARRDGIVLTGKGMPGAAAGWSASTMCVDLGDGVLNVSLYFDTEAKIGGLLTVTLRAKDGKYTVDGESGDFTVLLISHRSAALEAYSKVFAGAKNLPGVALHSLEPGDAFGGTATVDTGAADRPHGSFSVAGLVDAQTAAEVSLSLPFSCAKVVVLKSS